MSYVKIFEILPIELIEQIQNYVDGESIYIPRKEKDKKAWGENTDTKKQLSIRNNKIYKDYKEGMTVEQLSEKYFLVNRSIQRILNQIIKDK